MESKTPITTTTKAKERNNNMKIGINFNNIKSRAKIDKVYFHLHNLHGME